MSYGPLARALHWLMVVLIVLQATMGLIMVYGGPEPNVWKSLADTLQFYSVHKSLGVVLLVLVLLRLANRVLTGTPPPDSGLAVWQRETSELVHAWMYFLLLLVPLLGWIGVSLYPALTVFDGVNLPALLPPDRPTSEWVFVAHRTAAFVLLALVAVHIGAALYHRFIRRDGVLARMWPGSGPKA